MLFTLLAQANPQQAADDVAAAMEAASPANIFEVITSIFSRGDALAHPDELARSLTSMGLVWAFVFLAAGVTCLINGYRYHKTVMIVGGLMFGGFFGYYLGDQIGSAYIVAGCLAVLVAVICVPLMKYAIAIFGGMAGAFAGVNLWSGVGHLMQHDAMVANYWVGGLIGLIVIGMMSFILAKLSIVMFTSVAGATLAVFGGVALLLQIPDWRAPVVDGLSAHAVIIPLLVFVPAIIGLIVQQTQPNQPAAS